MLKIRTSLISNIQYRKWNTKKDAIQTIKGSVKRSAQYINTFITPLDKTCSGGVILHDMSFPSHLNKFLENLNICNASGYPQLKEKILIDLENNHHVFLQGTFLYKEDVEDIDILSIRKQTWQQYPKTIGRHLQTSIVIQFDINRKNKLEYKIACFSPIAYELIKKTKITTLNQLPKHPNIQISDSPSEILSKIESHVKKPLLTNLEKQLFLHQAMKQLKHIIYLRLKTTNHQYKFINNNTSKLSIKLNKNETKVDYVTPEISQMLQENLSYHGLLKKIETLYETSLYKQK